MASSDKSDEARKSGAIHREQCAWLIGPHALFPKSPQPARMSAGCVLDASVGVQLML